MTDTPTPPRRRWFRFSLRTILIMTAIAALAMSVWPWILHRPKWGTTYYIDSKGVEQELKFGKVPELWYVNSNLIFPAIALTAFVTWKLWFRFANRRRSEL